MDRYTISDLNSSLTDMSLEMAPLEFKGVDQEITEALCGIVAKHILKVSKEFKLENPEKTLESLKIRPITYDHCKLAFEAIKTTPSIVLVKAIGDSVNTLFYEMEYGLKERRDIYERANIEFNPTPDEPQQYFTLVITDKAMESLKSLTEKLSKSMDTIDKN